MRKFLPMLNIQVQETNTGQGWFLLSFLPSSWYRAQHEGYLCTEAEVALVSF